MRDAVTILRFNLQFSFLLLCLLIVVPFASAQDDDVFDPDAAPPPAKVISKKERSQLAAEADLKDRTKLALALMNDRLTKAEALNEQGNFAEMYTELGGFHALMDETVAFLVKNSGSRGLSSLKKLEITLRQFAPRLGLIRRELPSEYDPYVRSLIRYLRDARSKAVEPMFGSTVMPTRREP